MYSYLGKVEADKEKFYIDETVEAPVIRWKSNNNIPPLECLDAFLKVGYITKQEFDNSNEQRQIEVSARLEEYRKQMENYVPSAEEQYEMRAAFGAGAKVVNVITGATYNV